MNSHEQSEKILSRFQLNRTNVLFISCARLKLKIPATNFRIKWSTRNLNIQIIIVSNFVLLQLQMKIQMHLRISLELQCSTHKKSHFKITSGTKLDCRRKRNYQRSQFRSRELIESHLQQKVKKLRKLFFVSGICEKINVSSFPFLFHITRNWFLFHSVGAVHYLLLHSRIFGEDDSEWRLWSVDVWAEQTRKTFTSSAGWNAIFRKEFPTIKMLYEST